MSKMQPAPTRMSFALSSEIVNGTHYIDLFQCASIINRRFYRQGLNWAVSGFTFISGTNAGATVSIEKIQTSWTTSGSWEKTMRHWLKQQNEAIEEAGTESVTARFRDYKIHMDDQHVANGFAANLLPWSSAVPFVPGEWEASQIVIPNDGAPGVTNEYFVKLYGASDATSKGIIEGYALSRSVPQTPDPSTIGSSDQSWISEMINVGDSEDSVLVNAQYNNRNLPYSQLLYPGAVGNGGSGELVDSLIFTNTTLSAKQSARGSEFPCGLIKLNLGGFTQNMTIFVDLVPGMNRGYLTQDMKDM